MVKRKVSNQLPKMLLLFGVGLLAGVLAASFLIEKSVDNLSQETTGQFALVRGAAVQSRSPTECFGLDSCDNAKANGGLAAVSSAGLGNYTNYSFLIPAGSRLSSVVVRADAFADSKAARMSVAVSDNNGVSWAKAHVITPRLFESSYSIDVTADRVWGIAKLNNQQLRVKVKCYSSDNTEVTCNLDWIPVTVRYR